MQPLRPKPCWLFGLLVAAVTCFWVQVVPPSLEVSTNSGWLLPGHRAEARVADVRVAEVRTGGGVVGPDLLLVGEERRVLLAGDHRGAPRGAAPGRRGPGVVGVGDRDGLEALERGGAGDRGGQVRVVQAGAVGVAEPAAGGRLGAEGHRGVAVGDQAVLGVVRQGADQTPLRDAGGIVVADHAGAATSGQALVRRLLPGGARVDGEVDAGDADAGGERTVVVRAGVARLHVDVVVGARHQDGRVDRVDGDGRFVLLVGRERTVGAAGADEGVARVGQHGVGGCPGLGAGGGGEDETGENGYGAKPKDGLHSASMRVS